MAQQGVQQEQLRCSICLDLLKDPVSVPCGHSYCMGCIKGFWDQDDQKGLYSCPQCRETFNPRPVLKKNTMLAEVVESMKKTGLQAVPPDHGYAGPGDVACDVCTGEKLRAVKTCLQCLVSYCDTHLQPHYQSPAFKKHKLVKASSELQENICSLHNEVKKIFCRTDQQCICYLCCMEEHKGHDTTSAEAERTERLQNILRRIQEREKDVKVLHQQVESVNLSADKAVEDSDTVFAELISSMERKRSEVREQIRDRQKREVSRVEELRKCVEQEVSALRSRYAELEHISHTDDHIHFLHSYTSSLSKISESTHPVISSVCHFEDVTVSVSMMRDKLEDILKEEETNVSEAVAEAEYEIDDLLKWMSTPKPKPKPKPRPKLSRAEFLKYSCQLTLDTNTAHERLSLSQWNTKVTRMNYQRPERFTDCSQVLSVEGLTRRSYWEVEWSGKMVGIAVTEAVLDKTGTFNESGFGMTFESFSIECQAGGYSLRHGGEVTKLQGPVSSRVGVFCDTDRSEVTFCSITDTGTMTHICTANTQFLNEPLYAGFWIAAESTAEFCDMDCC